MKTTEEMIAVMKAYNERNKIECKHRMGEWENCPFPQWNWLDFDYRVKEEPKYRPYESADEMIEDFCKRAGLETTSMSMPSIWLREKGSTTKRLVIGLVGDYVYLQFSSEIDNWSLSELFTEYTYLDGSPVGKENGK